MFDPHADWPQPVGSTPESRPGGYRRVGPGSPRDEEELAGIGLERQVLVAQVASATRLRPSPDAACIRVLFMDGLSSSTPTEAHERVSSDPTSASLPAARAPLRPGDLERRPPRSPGSGGGDGAGRSREPRGAGRGDGRLPRAGGAVPGYLESGPAGPRLARAGVGPDCTDGGGTDSTECCYGRPRAGRSRAASMCPRDRLVDRTPPIRHVGRGRLPPSCWPEPSRLSGRPRRRSGRGSRRSRHRRPPATGTGRAKPARLP